MSGRASQKSDLELRLKRREGTCLEKNFPGIEETEGQSWWKFGMYVRAERKSLWPECREQSGSDLGKGGGARSLRGLSVLLAPRSHELSTLSESSYPKHPEACMGQCAWFRVPSSVQ